ncbi:uncharacterized protein V1510DRAFT_182923 [Dipodascopsis tothii]|uniref:uncharacterized protein n=1 Tax=Dipodascopsis tothii TaxID=44089 RepID=UPI0034CFEC63
MRFFFGAVLALQLALAAGCGVGVHVQVLSRIRQSLPKDLQALGTYTIPGAFFPDAFYGCFKQSDAAEAAHWPPFMKTAVQYYLDTYKTVDNPAGLGLRAFLYGAFTHQVADISWHSLGVDQGLLMAMALREFGGDYTTAHSTLDTGGDMIMMARLMGTSADLGWLKQHWTVPHKDLIAIFARAGYTITPAALEYCMARGAAGLGAELRIAQTIYPRFAKRSPLLYEALEPYFLGGVQELTLATSECVANLNSWFSAGPPASAWDLCYVFAGRAPSAHLHTDEQFVSVGDFLREEIDLLMPSVQLTHSADGSETIIEVPDVGQVLADEPGPAAGPGPQIVMAAEPTFLSTGVAGSMFGAAFAFGNFRGDAVGPCVAIGAPLDPTETDARDGSVYVVPLAEIEPMMVMGSHRLDLAEWRVTLPAEARAEARAQAVAGGLPHRFGESLAAIYTMNQTYLAVSAPGLSSVTLFSGPSTALTILPAALPAYGKRGHKQVGVRLVVEDVDADGLQELLVCAPYSDLSSSVREQGELVVLSGRMLATALAAGKATVGMDALVLPGVLNRTTVAPAADAAAWELFGANAAASARTRSVYVAAEGSSYVSVYDSSDGMLVTTLAQVVSQNATADHFGKGVLLTGHLPFLGEWLLVGSPNESLTKGEQTGVVYLYIVDATTHRPELACLIVGGADTSQFGRFGFAGAKTDDDAVVFISSPYAGHNRGIVWRLDMVELLARVGADGETVASYAPDAVVDDAVAQTAVYVARTAVVGATKGTGFGSALGHHSGLLFVGAPMHGFGDVGTNLRPDRQLAGGVHVYNL